MTADSSSAVYHYMTSLDINELLLLLRLFLIVIVILLMSVIIILLLLVLLLLLALPCMRLPVIPGRHVWLTSAIPRRVFPLQL